MYDQVVIHGAGRAGESELLQATREQWVIVKPLADRDVVNRFAASNISEIDAAVVACAIENRIPLVLADDSEVRNLTEREGLLVMGSIGILVQARLQGVIQELKPLLDKLVVLGFHVAGLPKRPKTSRRGAIEPNAI